MALSEHEEQVIEQLERALYESDPTFVGRLGLKNAWFEARRRILLAFTGLALGLSLLLAFCLTTVVVVGVLGFVVMAISLDSCWSGVRAMILARAEVKSRKATPPGQ